MQERLLTVLVGTFVALACAFTARIAPVSGGADLAPRSSVALVAAPDANCQGSGQCGG
jgi:hypothetical protein